MIIAKFISELEEYGSWDFSVQAIVLHVGSAASLIVRDVRLMLVVPFQISFGFTSSFVPYYILGTVIAGSANLGRYLLFRFVDKIPVKYTYCCAHYSMLSTCLRKMFSTITYCPQIERGHQINSRLTLQHLCGSSFCSHRARRLRHSSSRFLGCEHLWKAVGDESWRRLLGFCGVCAVGSFKRATGHLGPHCTLFDRLWNRQGHLGEKFCSSKLHFKYFLPMYVVSTSSHNVMNFTNTGFSFYYGD